jgi:hypothetical protein
MPTATRSSLQIYKQIAGFVNIAPSRGIIFHPHFPVSKITKYILNNRLEGSDTLNQNFSLENNRLLAASVAHSGVERRVDAFLYDGGVVLYDGHRRLWATRLAKITTIPLALHTKMTLEEASSLAMMNNMKRDDPTKLYLREQEQAVAVAKMVKSFGGNITKALRYYVSMAYPNLNGNAFKQKINQQFSFFSVLNLLGSSPISLDLMRNEFLAKNSAARFASLEQASPKKVAALAPMIKSYGAGPSDGTKKRRLPFSLAMRLYEAARSGKDMEQIFKKIMTAKPKKVKSVVSVRNFYITRDGRARSKVVKYYDLVFRPGDSKKAVIGSAANLCHKKIEAERMAYRRFIKEVNACE